MRHAFIITVMQIIVIAASSLATELPSLRPLPPGMTDLERYYSSIGALTRQSQFIVRCEIGRPIGTWEGVGLRKNEEGIVIAVNEKQRYFGITDKTGPITEVAYNRAEDVPAEGTEAILFLTKKFLSSDDMYGTMKAVADIDGRDGLSHWYVVGGKRGSITGTEERLEYMEAIIRKYIQHIRSDEFDAWQYLLFLTSLSESHDDRVRIDGWNYDYVQLMSTENIGRELSEKAWKTSDIPLVLKDRLELSRERRLQTWERIRANMRTREEVRNVLESANWYEDIASGDNECVRRAVLYMRKNVSHYELLDHRDVWQDEFRKLLIHEDADIRVWAADILGRYGNSEGIPILIRALRDDKWMRRGLHIRLQRITGQNLPFDPDAPENERESMVKAWEEWWERESERKIE